KQIDPKNWGAAGINPAELDPKLQEKDFVYYKKEKTRKERKARSEAPREEKKVIDKKNHKEYRRSASRVSRTPMSELADSRLRKIANRQTPNTVLPVKRKAELNPVEQVASKSYLGKALEASRRASKRRPKGTPSSPSTSPESSDSSEPETEDESRPSGTDAGDEASEKSGSTSSGSESDGPSQYDGTADSRLYHRFITEGTAYVEDSEI
ncbi:hypothetical protein H0H93_012803, partial [Arthromyces matolae]